MFRRSLLLLGLSSTLVALAACGGSSGASPAPSGSQVAGFNEAIDRVVNPSGAVGGILRLVSTRGCSDWIPAQAWSPWCMNMQRLITRQLMTYGDDAGKRGAVVLPDLAAAAGMPNDDRTVWTYQLKSGMRWENGSPITAEQVAAGIRTLDVNRRDFFVTSIATDPSSVTITLRDAVTDLDSLLALPASAPIPEGGGFLASGPYRIIADGDVTVLERNPEWTQASDPVRKPKVDRIEFTVLDSDQDVTDAVRDGSADLAVQGRMDVGLAEAFMADPALAAQSDNPGTGNTAMLAVPANSSAALRNVECRRAVFSAIDRLAVTKVLAGGVEPTELAVGPATSLSPPTIPSFDWSYQPFAVGDGSGDVDAARASLVRCEQPDGFTATIAFADTVTNASVVDSLVVALARVGIRLDAMPVAPVDFVGLTGSPSRMELAGVDIALLVQSPRVSGVWGFWNPLTNGESVGRGLSTNVAQLKIPAVDILLDSTEITSSNPSVQENVGRMIDRLVLDSAKYIPLAYAKSLLHRPADLTNVTTNGALGNGYDLVNIGIAPTSNP